MPNERAVKNTVNGATPNRGVAFVKFATGTSPASTRKYFVVLLNPYSFVTFRLTL